MKTSSIDVVKSTIDKIADVVKQTMGGRGRLAVINDEFSRPLLTDDGVTVAKQFLKLDDPFERMVALSVCEAASNTEKYAFDGTTLTILLVQEIYNLGLKIMQSYNEDAQLVATQLQEIVTEFRRLLKDQTIKLTPKLAADLAVVTTKIPFVGDLVRQAYEKAGDEMNVIIEHDRKSDVSTVEQTSGMVLDFGYFSNEMQKLCNDETMTKTQFEGAHLVMLAEGVLSQRDITNFFRSIPSQHVKDPYVFFITRAFNPESLKMLLDQLVQNKFTFQFVFINDANDGELFYDLAAFTNGKVQSAAEGTSSYLWQHSGYADHITIEIDKTTIMLEPDGMAQNSAAVSNRIAWYKKELEDNKYSISVTRQDAITRRLSNLEGKVVKIKLGVQTATEFLTLRLKLDDAIGAVRCAAKEGLLVGGGKALWNLTKYVYQIPNLGSVETDGLIGLLQTPMRTIAANAGKAAFDIEEIEFLNAKPENTYNVETGLVDGVESGLVDSFSAIDRALSNAVSIATSYLKAFILINTIA